MNFAGSQSDSPGCANTNTQSQRQQHWYGATNDNFDLSSASNAAALSSAYDLPELRGKSDILELHHIRELSKYLPARAEGYAWTLAFTTSHMGFSLRSLYRSLSKYEGPVLLMIKDTEQVVFGAFCSCNLQQSESFYGTGETYLFTFKPQQLNSSTSSDSSNNNSINNNNNNNNNNSININATNIISSNPNNKNISNQSATALHQQQQQQRLTQQQQSQRFGRFPWTGDNLYFIKGNSDSLVIGAGEGNFGLWLDEDLYHGTTHSCKTFNNEPLTLKEDFVVSALECWCFL